jgi:hypothetical protein
MRPDQTIQIIKHVRLDLRWTVFENFHADNSVVMVSVGWGTQIVNRRKLHVGDAAETPAAIAQLLSVEVCTNRLAKQVVRQRDEGPVSTSVIEQRAAGTGGGELASDCKSAAMAPCDDRIAAKDLLSRVVALLYQLWGSGRHRRFIGHRGADLSVI